MQAVIMAGGKGTRLSSITGDKIPKPMVTIDEKPILEYQIKCLKESGITEIIIIVGHLHETIQQYFGKGEKWGVSIRYIIEAAPMGTAGALFYLKTLVDKAFILLFGDIFLNMDFSRMIRFHQERMPLATLLVHPNSHPFDSDLVILDGDGRITGTKKKNEKREGYYKNIVNAGIYCLDASLLETFNTPEKKDLERDVIFPLIEAKAPIYGYHSPEYIKDIGTPERLLEAEQEWRAGIVKKKNLKNRQKCIFVDRDGTLNRNVGLLTRPEDLELEHMVPEALNLAHKKGYLVIVITNQPVIARNKCTLEELEQIHNKMETELGERGAYLDTIKFCPHHPDSGYPEERREYKIKCNCRKPATGLIEEAVREFNIEKTDSYMIGDTTTDIQTGINAGLKTILVQTEENGKDGKYQVAADLTAPDLLAAIQRIE